jgi:murein DD-endopeptidase MepM/ murein hydrolase activator NlpD
VHPATVAKRTNAEVNIKFISSHPGRTREIDLTKPRTLALTGAVAAVVVGGLFAAGAQLGSYLAGDQRSDVLERKYEHQRLELQATRGQLEGNVDELASRVGTLNAHLIRLDALGRRVVELADLDRGEFNFDDPPPAGGPEQAAGSSNVPELISALDSLEAQLRDRERQMVVLEDLMSTRDLRQRIQPGGWPLAGGWISSGYGTRSDPFTGRRTFHAGIDVAAKPGSKVNAVGPGLVSFSGYKAGYGYMVEITHPTGYVTRYGHNSRNLVAAGQAVQKGQPIAVIGSTGRSTGTHVHFEVEREGKRVDPSRYLADT